MEKKIKRRGDYTHNTDKHTLELTSGIYDFEHLMHKMQEFILSHNNTSVQSVGNNYSGYDEVVLRRKMKIKIIGG